MLLATCLTAGCRDSVDASYSGLQGQSVASMAWADRSLRTDFPNVQFDVAAAVQLKLQQATESKTAPELKESTYPVRSESINQYQEDYPQIETMAIADVAPKFGVSRLVYVEIEQLRTRSVGSWDLFRGFMQGTVRVIEIDAGKGRIGFEDRNVIAVFPPKTPEEGIPSGNDEIIYRGIVNEFSKQVALLFFTHEPE